MSLCVSRLLNLCTLRSEASHDASHNIVCFYDLLACLILACSCLCSKFFIYDVILGGGGVHKPNRLGDRRCFVSHQVIVEQLLR